MPYYKMDSKSINVSDTSNVNTDINVEGIEYDQP